MAKAFVTRVENLDDIWVFDVDSIDDDFVVFHDGSRRLAHRDGAEAHFWKTEEEAIGAIQFARMVMRFRLQKIREHIGIFENEAMNYKTTITQKN